MEEKMAAKAEAKRLKMLEEANQKKWAEEERAAEARKTAL